MKAIRQVKRLITHNKRLIPQSLRTTTIVMRHCCTINTNKNAFLSNFFNQTAEIGHNDALIFDDHNISYSELYKSSLNCALYLREKYHIKQGDVISIIAQNIPQIQTVMIACHMLNCVYFPINGSLPIQTIQHYINSVHSQLIITDNAKLIPLLDESNSKTIYVDTNQINTNKLSWIGDEYTHNTNMSLVESIMTDIINNENEYNDINHSLYFQTSGSTALPKIVTHSNTSADGWLTNGLNSLFKGTKALLTSQSYHVSSYFILMSNLCNGGTIIYPSEIMRDSMANTKIKCLEMLRLSDLYKVNTVTLIVTPVYELVKLEKSFGNNVNALACGGDIIPVGLMQKFMKLHTKNDNTMILNGYGSTEAGLIGLSDPLLCNEENSNNLEIIQNNLIHVNKCPQVEHKVDEKTGELYVKSNAIMKGYYNEPEKTAEVFTDDGYYKTGDTIKVMEDNGEDILKFMVVSRNKQVIVGNNGRFIFPQCIENQLLSHKMVNGAVVIGIDCKLLFNDDNINGEYKYPVAFVRVCNNKLNDEQRDNLINELMILCEKRNKNEVPFKIFIVDDIPRSHIGKVDRNKLTDFANKYFEFIYKKQKLYENEVFALVCSRESQATL